MSEQSIPSEDGLVLWQDVCRMISLHAGSSPGAADIVFVSIADNAARDELHGYVLRELGSDDFDVPEPSLLRDGFHVHVTPPGRCVVFVVTNQHGAQVNALLHTNLWKILSTFRHELAGKTIWLPLLGAGRLGLSSRDSLKIMLSVLLQARLGSRGSPTRVQIELPQDLPGEARQRLYREAREIVLGDPFVRHYRRDSPASTIPLEYREPLESVPGEPWPRPDPRLALGPASGRELSLVALLSKLFDDDGLRRWVYLALGKEVHQALPGAPVAFDELCFRLVLQLQQRGLIQPDLFAALSAERPAQAAQIRALAEQWTRSDALLSAGRLVLEPRPARPRYGDARTRLLGEQLAAAYDRKRALEATDASTAEIVQQILNLKREIRSGGQLWAGDRLGDGRYLLLERIGRGGFANVWRALDQVSGKCVAVKVLHGELAGDVIRRERFFRGARVMNELEHPAVVRIIEPHGEDDGYHYFVMELITGGDLRRAVLDRRVGASDVVPLLLRLGSALEKAHARSYVHRDVKPANVLLTEDRDPLLTDFDLVAAAETTGGTRTGALGTFIYAAPEVLDRPQDADARADVYGLGMTAAFVIHGADLPRTVLRNAGAFIVELSCDERLKWILQRAVAWDAAERFVNAAAFCTALRSLTSTPRENADAPARGSRDRASGRTRGTLAAGRRKGWWED